jgi:hypothetical protein
MKKVSTQSFLTYLQEGNNYYGYHIDIEIGKSYRFKGSSNFFVANCDLFLSAANYCVNKKFNIYEIKANSSVDGYSCKQITIIRQVFFVLVNGIYELHG